jgi:hypothetical protein
MHRFIGEDDIIFGLDPLLGLGEGGFKVTLGTNPQRGI